MSAPTENQIHLHWLRSKYNCTDWEASITALTEKQIQLHRLRSKYNCTDWEANITANGLVPYPYNSELCLFQVSRRFCLNASQNHSIKLFVINTTAVLSILKLSPGFSFELLLIQCKGALFFTQIPLQPLLEHFVQWQLRSVKWWSAILTVVTECFLNY